MVSIAPAPSLRPRQYLLQFAEEVLPAIFCALVILLLIRPEAGLLHAQQRARALGRQRQRNDALDREIGFAGIPSVRQRFVRLDHQDLTVDDAVPTGLGRRSKAETMAYGGLEVVLHQPLLDQVRLGERAPDLFRR